MKKLIPIIFISLFILTGGILISQSTVYKTVEDAPACIYFTDMEELYEIAISGDKDAILKFWKSKEDLCFFLKGGVEVYITNEIEHYIEIRPKGQTGRLWTWQSGVE